MVMFSKFKFIQFGFCLSLCIIFVSSCGKREVPKYTQTQNSGACDDAFIDGYNNIVNSCKFEPSQLQLNSCVEMAKSFKATYGGRVCTASKLSKYGVSGSTTQVDVNKEMDRLIDLFSTLCSNEFIIGINAVEEAYYNARKYGAGYLLNCKDLAEDFLSHYSGITCRAAKKKNSFDFRPDDDQTEVWVNVNEKMREVLETCK